MLSSFMKFAALLLKFVITWFWLSWSTRIITYSPGRHNLTDQIAQIGVRISSLFISYQILRYDFPPIFLILGLVRFKPELTSYFYITFPIIYE